MVVLILLIFVVIIIGIIAGVAAADSKTSISKTSTETELELHETPDPNGEPMSKFSCFIAGLAHHRDDIKLGGFVGYGVWDHQNPYDELAIAIYNCDGKLYGYVPRQMHDDYLSFFPDKAPAFVVGFVDVDADGFLRGKAYFVRNHSWEYAKNEISDLIKWMQTYKGIEMQRSYETVLQEIDVQIAQKHAKMIPS